MFGVYRNQLYMMYIFQTSVGLSAYVLLYLMLDDYEVSKQMLIMLCDDLELFIRVFIVMKIK